MLIKSIKLRNNPALGDIDLDLHDGSGNVFRTVVLAGGNGVGKTAILDAIQAAFELQLGASIGDVYLTIMLEPDEVRRLKTIIDIPSSVEPMPPEYTLIYQSNQTSNWDRAFQLAWHDQHGALVESPSLFVFEEKWKGFFRSFYSEASVNFVAAAPQSITSTTTDPAGVRARRSGSQLAQEITQLLVDIRASDAEELALWVERNPDIAPPPDVKDRQFSRFRKAFNYMFPSKRFRTVSRAEGQLRPEFEEHGRISGIDKLSTGEKQIVFRAGFLLRDLAATPSAIILIDEPELSLHPEWQERIMGFYTTLLSDENGRHPQIIAATHSPFIVHGAANAKTVILQKDQSTGQISEMGTPSYPGVHGNEAVRAFNVDAFIDGARQQLLVLTEGDTDADIFKVAWEKLRPGQPRPFELRSALGAKNINITLNDQELFAKLSGRKIAGVFDFDDAFNHWKGVWSKGSTSSQAPHLSEADGLVKKHSSGSGWAMLLPVPNFRRNFASKQLAGGSILSVEFLFEDTDLLPGLVAFRALAYGQQQPYVVQGYKTAFASHVASLPATSFAAFGPLLARFDDILAGRL
jgi:ABC-type cobalamin/Fe3+-siderophores transport system ATPase subunit